MIIQSQHKKRGERYYAIFKIKIRKQIDNAMAESERKEKQTNKTNNSAQNINN